MLACGYSNRNTSAVRTLSSIQFRQLAAPAISSLILMSSRVSFSSACRDNFRRLASSPYFVLWLRNIFSSFVPRLSDVFGSFITRLSHALIGRKPPFGRYRNTRLLNQSSSRCGGGVDTVFEFGHFFTGSLGLLFGCSHDRFQWPERVGARGAENRTCLRMRCVFVQLQGHHTPLKCPHLLACP